MAAVLRSGIVPAALSFHAMLLAAIAWIYVGFAMLDGRRQTIGVESAAAVAFLAAAFVGLLYSPYLIAMGFAGHGLWDLAHHPHGITTTVPRWYPRFCAVYDFVHAGFFVALGFASTG